MQLITWVVFVLSLPLCAVPVAAQGASCPADFAPTLAQDGLVYLNPCVATAQGAVIVKSDKGHSVPGARPVTDLDMNAHASESFRFMDFAVVRRIEPTMNGGATSSVSAPSLQGLPPNRVVLYSVAHGAIYATAAPAALPSGQAAVSRRAVRGQPGDMFKQQQQQQQPASGSAQPTQPPAPGATDAPLLRGSLGPSSATEQSQQQQDSSSSSDGQQQDSSSSRSNRKLRFVRSVDERRTVAEQPAGVPLASVGQLLSYGQEWHCSASLIGERTIITAAHCVYDRSSGAFARGLYFVPGRYRDASGAIRAPYGAYDVAEVYIASQFISGEPQDIWDVDLAVLRLQDNVQVGKVLGYFGVEVPAVVAAPAEPAAAMTAAAAAAAAKAVEVQATNAAGTPSTGVAAAGRRALPGRKQQQQNARLWQGQLSTAGYPSDREEGTLVRTKCQAQQALVSAVGGTIKLTGCSTHLGQSGSALFNDKAQVRGVVSFEIVGAGGYNGGSAISHSSFEALIRPYAV